MMHANPFYLSQILTVSLIMSMFICLHPQKMHPQAYMSMALFIVVSLLADMMGSRGRQVLYLIPHLF